MKTRYLLFLALLIFAASANATCLDCQQEEKIYIHAHQVSFFEEKIFVHFENEFFNVPALYSDELGMFILMKQPRGRCEPYEWKCDKCGTCNALEEPQCIKCKNWM